MHCFAWSSLEILYKALAAFTCEVQWLLFLLKELQFPLTSPCPLYCGNHSAIYIANNKILYFMSEPNTQIEFHFVREKVLHMLDWFIYCQFRLKFKLLMCSPRHCLLICLTNILPSWECWIYAFLSLQGAFSIMNTW